MFPTFANFQTVRILFSLLEIPPTRENEQKYEKGRPKKPARSQKTLKWFYSH